MNSRLLFSPWRKSRNSRLAISVLFISLAAMIFSFVPRSQGQGQAPAASAQSSSVVPLHLGIAGLVHGHVFGFFQTYLHDPSIQIVGIAEPDKDLAGRVSHEYKLDKDLFYTSLDEMLDKTHPQAVVIYSSTYDHRQLVEICARHHVDVMMEKPLAVSYADALAIQKAATEGGIQVLVNYETTWYASNRAAYDLLHEHALGDLRKFVAHDGHRGPKEISVGPDFMKWLGDPKLDGGGALYDFGCYGADLVTWMMDGQAPETVTAATQQIKPEEYPNVDDEATIILTYPKAQAIIQASWNWPIGRKDIEVYGQTGTVKTVLRDNIIVQRSEQQKPEELMAKPLAAPYDDSIKYLRAVVLDKMTPEGPSSLRINLVVAEILDRARESAATGKTIRLHEK